MTTLLLIIALMYILSHVLDAKEDAARDNGRMNHAIEVLKKMADVLSGFFTACFISNMYHYGYTNLSLILALVLFAVAFVLFRLGSFNWAYNKARKKPIHYIGTSDNASIIDKLMIKVPEKVRLSIYIASLFLAFTCLALIEEIILIG